MYHIIYFMFIIFLYSSANAEINRCYEKCSRENNICIDTVKENFEDTEDVQRNREYRYRMVDCDIYEFDCNVLCRKEEDVSMNDKEPIINNEKEIED